MGSIMERINQLTEERLELFSQASNGRRGDPAVQQRIRALERELERLWAARRAERAGRLDGIDAVVDASYRQAYGSRYEEVFRPLPVAEPSDEAVLAAAA
jgi:hypothetical protein